MGEYLILSSQPLHSMRISILEVGKQSTQNHNIPACTTHVHGVPAVAGIIIFKWT